MNRRALPAVILLAVGASCSNPLPGAVGADGGAPAAGEGATFTLLPPSSEFQSWLQAGGASQPVDTVVDGQTVSLGHIPSPASVPQPPLAIPYGNPPATYDLRTLSRLTAIRDQGGCGSCWTFGTYASAESGLLPSETQDFSEEHLNNNHGFDIPACQGGNAAMSIGYMARWAGAVAESDCPYTAQVKSYGALPLRKHLENADTIPDRAGPLDNAAIKNAVITYGAVMTTIQWANAAYNASTSSMNNNAAGSANHAVAIVGWDDNYAASNFLSKPAGNGAFIMRNSWGTGFGLSGYFYISYYDSFVGKGNNAFNVMAPSDDYTEIYQYDTHGYTSAVSEKGTVAYAANIFTAKSNNALGGVGFFTTVPSTTVDVYVYDSPAGAPNSGKQVATASATETYAGYHTMILGTPFTLTSGHTFAIVVKMTIPSGTSYVAIEYPFQGYSSKIVTTKGTGYVSADGSNWSDAQVTWGSNVPIKGFASAPASCDDGNPCTTDGGVVGNCTHTPVAKGTVCRAAAGACDVAEACDGTAAPCPADAKLASNTVCRAAAGACDLAEVCDGVAAACPADKLAAAKTVCRAAAGACDVAEACDGKTAACPADAVVAAKTVCRAAVGACDVAESCDGKSGVCPADAVAAAKTVCRAAAGACDAAETCDGKTGACPADVLAAAGTVCRAAAGDCDVAEACTGKAAACPADVLKPASTVCRAAAGDCDSAESCTGKTAACPADVLKPASTVCRAAAGACDVAESCTGKTAACPADAVKPAKTVCRAAAGTCDVAEACDGSSSACPADGFVNQGTVCRKSIGTCDETEVCSGMAAACPADVLISAGTVCRAAAGDCDVAEVCTGKVGTCPADALKPASTVCRPAAGACDIAESCTGKAVACPADQVRPKGYACGANLTCNGSATTCGP